MVSNNKKKLSSADMSYSYMESRNILRVGEVGPVVEKPSVLIHSCCGPCSTSVIERLVDEFNVTVFFYNPCITDEREYNKRLENQKKFIQEFNRDNIGRCVVYFKEGEYRPEEYRNRVRGLESEKEGGLRCRECFIQRLEKTAEMAGMTGFDYFGTTLTVSPHKSYDLISGIGRALAVKYGVSYLDRNFKKQDGFKRSGELSRKYNLYRQNYCGCEYSKRREE